MAEGGEQTTPAPAGVPRGPSQASKIVALAQGRCGFFHDGEVAYASMRVSERRETHQIASSKFRSWLSALYFADCGAAPDQGSVGSAVATLTGRALFYGPQRKVSLRIGEGAKGAIYIDLGDPEWNLVQITASGWSVVSSSKIDDAVFRRPRVMRSLPMPQREGSFNELRPFVNVEDQDFVLVGAWLLAALRPTGPYPLLSLQGAPGAAKSSLAKVLRGLVDPNQSDLRAEPGTPRDLAITGNGSWIVAIDNQSSIPVWLSDALCRLSTGGGFSTRELYTNDEEAIFDQQRPTLITAIGEVVTKGDLLDRTILINLPEIEKDKRKGDTQFLAEFDKVRPRIFGALLDGVACAIKNVGSVSLEKGLPRLADFALWAAAGVPALGFGADEFENAYLQNQKDAIELNLEVSAIAPLVVQIGAEGFEDTATQLLAKLNSLATDALKRRRDWPKSTNWLSSALRKLAPSLAASGTKVEFKKGKDGRRIEVSAIKQRITI